jgi:cellulose synthase operon protein C
MKLLFRATALPLLLAAAVSLSACKTDEEKAVEYFQSGQALLAEGDEDRALVEFRNVFKYDPFHFEARKTYADVLVKRGELPEAYSQYLRLIEQYPDTADVRLILARLAIGQSDWEEAERHGREAIRLAPDLPEVKVVALALDYRLATLDEDQEARAVIARQAEAMLQTMPENAIARRIVIDQLAAGPDPMRALPLVDQALTYEPKALEYHMMKYLLLAQNGDVEATGTQLKQMFDLFPENEEVRSALIRWYGVQRDFDGAEAFLRKVAGAPTGPVEPQLGLLQFLQAQRGNEAARAELQALIIANGESENAQLYAAMLAAMDFDAGQRDQAVATLRAILAKAQPSQTTNRIKGMLARSLDQMGDRAGASALVEEVLAVDHTHAVALKLRAGWAIAADKIEPAVQDLNAALSSAPRDPEVFTLLALTQQRDGNAEAMGEYLAQAVAASGAASAESLRYAGFLVGQGNPRQAEEVLTEAWRLSPANRQILSALADLFITQEKWPPAMTAIGFLEEQGAEGTAALKATVLDGSGQSAEAIEVLQEQIDAGKSVPANAQALIRILLRGGDPAGARAFLDGLRAKHPDDRDLQLLSAGMMVQEGKVDQAVTLYQQLIAAKPGDEPPVRLLYGVLAARGRAAEASAVLEAGLSAMPGARTLMWLKAGELERDGKFEEAIAAYETLYAADATDVLVANNLASLLASYRNDPESLARAEAMSRRLRGQPNAAFQDTYGWIAFLTGNTYGAIAHLEPAAKGLPDDALTQYHLGKLYQSMDRAAEALGQFDKALALAVKTPTLAGLPQMKDAEAQRATLQAELDSKAP